jgi:hypothetical protein
MEPIVIESWVSVLAASFGIGLSLIIGSLGLAMIYESNRINKLNKK